MKKLIVILFMTILVFPLSSCTKDTALVEQSDEFTKEEITLAIDTVQINFNFPAATLTKVWYDKEKTDFMKDNYMKSGRGSINGVKKENVIVLLSEFDVDNSGDNPVLNAGSTYTDYNWILIRKNKNSPWIIDDWGY